MLDADQYNQIEKILPELSEIKDEKIRAQVAEVWWILWKESKFERIEDVPFSASPKFTLVNLTRSVVKNSISTAKYLQEFHNLTINMDYLIALALLHDSSMMVEQDPEKPGSKNFLGQHIPHPLLGAEVARRVDLPVEIVHMLIMHTFHPPHVFVKPKYLEQVIFHNASLAIADSLIFSTGGATHLEKRRFFELA